MDWDCAIALIRFHFLSDRTEHALPPPPAMPWLLCVERIDHRNGLSGYKLKGYKTKGTTIVQVCLVAGYHPIVVAVKTEIFCLMAVNMQGIVFHLYFADILMSLYGEGIEVGRPRGYAHELASGRHHQGPYTASGVVTAHAHTPLHAHPDGVSRTSQHLPHAKLTAVGQGIRTHVGTVKSNPVATKYLLHSIAFISPPLAERSSPTIGPLVHKHSVTLHQHRLLSIQRNGQNVKHTYAEHSHQKDCTKQGQDE